MPKIENLADAKDCLDLGMDVFAFFRPIKYSTRLRFLTFHPLTRFGTHFVDFPQIKDCICLMHAKLTMKCGNKSSGHYGMSRCSPDLRSDPLQKYNVAIFVSTMCR